MGPADEHAYMYSDKFIFISDVSLTNLVVSKLLSESDVLQGLYSVQNEFKADTCLCVGMNCLMGRSYLTLFIPQVALEVDFQ